MKRVQAVSKGDSVAVVPEDVIFDMLLLLPVKTLIRFRSVCKRWRDVITNPSFAFSHYDSSYKRRASDRDSVEFMVTVTQENVGLIHPYRLSIDTKSNTEPEMLQRVHQPPEIRHPDFDLSSDREILLGPSLGVFCKVDRSGEKFALWNPATREVKVLPLPPLRNGTLGYGFGYCHGDGAGRSEFKFVRFIAPPVSKKYILQVCCFGTGSWRDVETALPCVCFQMGQRVEGVELNQTIHWYVWSAAYPTCDDPFIFTFNLRDGRCGSIYLPPAIVTDIGRGKTWIDNLYRLTTTGDEYLALVVPYEGMADRRWDCVDIWMMSTPSVWTRHARLQLKGMSPQIRGYWNNFYGGVVMFCQVDNWVEHPLVTLSPGENLVLFVSSVCGHKILLKEIGRARVVNYVESLITYNS